MFATHITQRQVYPQTASEGGTVFDSKNADALAEMSVLTDEILAFVDVGRTYWHYQANDRTNVTR